MGKIRVNIKLTDEESKIPYMSKPGSSGYDLFATASYTLHPGIPVLVLTGIRIAVPYGYEAQVRPRSGLALEGVTVVNTPGTIDSSYRGEVGVILIKHGTSTYEIELGDRVAQLVFSKVEEVIFVERDELDSTERNDGGFGHTGK